MNSMMVVQNIPDGSSASAIAADARVQEAAHAVGCILEGLGYSVFARIAPLHVVGELMVRILSRLEAVNLASVSQPIIFYGGGPRSPRGLHLAFPPEIAER